MQRHTLVLCGLAVVLPASLLLGRGSGVIAGETGVPGNLTSGFPGCGASGCHNQFPNYNVKVDLQLATSLRLGSGPVSITVAVSGANTSSTKGGFSLETSAGTFQGSPTDVRTGTTPSGRAAITHANSQQRKWTFLWQPPAQSGLVVMFAAANAANGDGRNSGDAWGWFGPDASIPGTAARVFINDSAVYPFGTACAGSQGFFPLLGIAKNAQVGGILKTEVHNVPPATATIGVLGLSDRTWGALPLPLDLTPFGAAGCSLLVSMDVLQAAATTGTGAGNGSGSHGWAVPNDARLRGLDLFFQALTLDATANALGFSLSAGLRAAIQ